LHPEWLNQTGADGHGTLTSKGGQIMAGTQSGKSRRSGSKAPLARIPDSPKVMAPRTRKAVSRKPAAPATDPAQWQEIVATAAYLRAASRGFVGGSPEQDWFEAEAELKTRLAPVPAK
jgi:hypothetical protein